jgi:hypothetical protein
MTPQVTMTDLVDALRTAASEPEKHADAQLRYFSKFQNNSVLTSHGYTCCVAGYLILKAHEGFPERKIEAIVTHCAYTVDPATWVREQLGLTYSEELLAFHPHTHHKIHSLLSDLLELGLCLPDDDDAEKVLGLSCNSSYTEFDYGYFGGYDADYMSLDEILAWMVKSAKKVQ